MAGYWPSSWLGEFLSFGIWISLNVFLLFCAAFLASEGKGIFAAFGLKYLSLQQEITPCRTSKILEGLFVDQYIMFKMKNEIN